MGKTVFAILEFPPTLALVHGWLFPDVMALSSGGHCQSEGEKCHKLDIFETPVTVTPQQEISKTLNSSKIP